MALAGRFEYFFRFMILTGYTIWFLWLYYSGNLYLYKHERFHLLTVIAALVLFVLAINQLYKAVSASLVKMKNHNANNNNIDESFHISINACKHQKTEILVGDEKSEKIKGNIKKIFTYLVFLLPLLLGFTINPASLDPAMAGQRGFNINQGSHFFNEGSGSLSEEIMKGPLVLDEKNFKQITEELWERPERYLGRDVTAIGFLHKPPGFDKGHYILGRFLVFCCIADYIVTGFAVEFQNDTELEEDIWIKISGKVDLAKYDDRDVGLVIVESFQKVEPPSNPYIFY